MTTNHRERAGVVIGSATDEGQATKRGFPGHTNSGAGVGVGMDY